MNASSALDALAADASVRVVVLGGAGKAFCAGHVAQEGASAFIEKRAPNWVADRSA
jgi:1,4-dihydroxy-2-naphthoyl-CoA synthase